MEDYLDICYCVVCMSTLKRGFYPPVIFNGAYYSICDKCSPLMLHPEKYGLIEDPLTFVECEGCSISFPRKLVFFPFIFEERRWSTCCWRCLKKLQAPLSLYEKTGRKREQSGIPQEQLKQKEVVQSIFPSKMFLKYDTLSDEERVYLRKIYYRVIKRNKRKFPKEINITPKDIIEQYLIQNGVCHYTGLKYTIKKKKSPLSISIDRIDSTRGYVKGNIVFCCWFVNAAKNEWDLKDIQWYWKYLPKPV